MHDSSFKNLSLDFIELADWHLATVIVFWIRLKGFPLNLKYSSSTVILSFKSLSIRFTIWTEEAGLNPFVAACALKSWDNLGYNNVQLRSSRIAKISIICSYAPELIGHWTFYNKWEIILITLLQHKTLNKV